MCNPVVVYFNIVDVHLRHHMLGASVEIIRILTEQVTNFAAMADYSTFLIVYKSRPLTMLLKLLLSFLLKIKIYGPGLVILSAYATSMPPVILLPLPKAKELNDFVDPRRADVLCLRADALKRWAHALERRAINLDRLADALDQRADALERRLDVLGRRVDSNSVNTPQ
ncbi:hypothetical protein Tco_0943930, partial [Tanacetum coccineum]